MDFCICVKHSATSTPFEFMMIFLIKMPKSMCNFLSRVFGLYLWLSRGLFWFRDGLSVGVQRIVESFFIWVFEFEFKIFWSVRLARKLSFLNCLMMLELTCEPKSFRWVTFKFFSERGCSARTYRTWLSTLPLILDFVSSKQ